MQRLMWFFVCGFAVAVSNLPNNRETSAAASDGVVVASAESGLSEVAPPADPCPVESEPMTVCTPEGCYRVASPPGSQRHSLSELCRAGRGHANCLPFASHLPLWRDWPGIYPQRSVYAARSSAAMGERTRPLVVSQVSHDGLRQ